jgi:hypothetical protein
VANPEHVELLKKGVAEWNAWRDTVRAEPNLSGTDLRDADLRNTNLRDADLRDANLRNANLSGAILRSATLHGADLHGADLHNASLRRADLSAANLCSVNLSDANLHGAILSGANLSSATLSRADLGSATLNFANLGNAILTEAKLIETVFVDVDLTSVIGLETCLHEGPSAIDYLTLQKFGPLPRVFLRGVGLPERLINSLPSLLVKDEYHSCFISYSSKDQEFAERLRADLQDKGVRCWFAPHDLPIGAKTWDAIDEAIKLRDKLLLVLSKNSIESDWVEDEVQKAFAEERDRKQLVLFPIRIDDAAMETPEPWARKLRDQRNIGDFRRWKDRDTYVASLERVVRDLTVKT